MSYNPNPFHYNPQQYPVRGPGIPPPQQDPQNPGQYGSSAPQSAQYFPQFGAPPPHMYAPPGPPAYGNPYFNAPSPQDQRVYSDVTAPGPPDQRAYQDMGYPPTSQYGPSGPLPSRGRPPPPQQQPQQPQQQRGAIPTRGGTDLYSMAENAPGLMMNPAPTQFWRSPPPRGPPQSHTPVNQDHSSQHPSPPGPPRGVQGPPTPDSQNSQNNNRNQPPQFNEDRLTTAAQLTFDRFDLDKGGYLDLQEFLDALRALHFTIAYHDAIDRFYRADSNGNGRISKDEFVRMFVDEMRNKMMY